MINDIVCAAGIFCASWFNFPGGGEGRGDEPRVIYSQPSPISPQLTPFLCADNLCLPTEIPADILRPVWPAEILPEEP